MSLTQLLKDHQIVQAKRKESIGLLNYCLLYCFFAILSFFCFYLIEQHKKNALRNATILGDELPELINKLLTKIFSQQVLFYFILFFFWSH